MDILTAAEASQLMGGVPLGTLRYWRHAGTGPASFKLGRRVVYRREVVEQWVREQEAADPRTAPAA